MKNQFMREIKKMTFRKLKNYHNLLSTLYDMFAVSDDEEDNKDFGYIVSQSPYDLISMIDRIVDIMIDTTYETNLNTIINDDRFKSMIKLYIRMNENKD